MNQSKVVIVPCADYEEEEVYRALSRGIGILGGIEQFVQPEEKILVKPNFLSASEPERAVATHPAVIRGMLRLLSEAGYGHVTYGDSPGHGSCKTAARKLGLDESPWGAVRANMEDEVLVPFPSGKTAKEFYFTRGVVEADAIISLCKMKTHALERITGAVKNLYGCICGYRKAAGHVKYPNAAIFARMLSDIHRCLQPRLHIMDGIIAMEGNGPSSGTPTVMKVLLFSADPVALDTVFCHLIYLEPELVPTNVQGAAMGIGTMDTARIELLLSDDSGTMSISFDELVRKYGSAGFNVDRTGAKKGLLNRYSDLMTGFARRPMIQEDLCVKCGICIEHCPVPGKALAFQQGKERPPVYDYNKCIRCYCCQEMCPQHAITVRGR